MSLKMIIWFGEKAAEVSIGRLNYQISLIFMIFDLRASIVATKMSHFKKQYYMSTNR
jgi:hypothetical protein